VPFAKCVPCNHGIAHPEIVDGGDGIQIQRIDATILNKQLWTADNGWSSSLPQKVSIMKFYIGPQT